MFNRAAIEEIRGRQAQLERELEDVSRHLDGIDDRIRSILRGEDGAATRDELAQVRKSLEETRTAVAHGIEDVERRENRIRSTVGRALKQLEEHGFDPTPGLEAEARGLELIDGGEGEPEGVQSVSEDVGGLEEALHATFHSLPGEFGPEDLETMRRRRASSA